MIARSIRSVTAWRALAIALAFAIVAPLAAAPAGIAQAPVRAAALSPAPGADPTPDAYDPAIAPTLASVEAGAYGSCAIFSDGTARCTGWNQYGEIGDGTSNWARLPAKVVDLEDVVDVSVGLNLACAVLGNGEAWCWGRDQEGQLGNDTPLANSNVPVRVTGIDDAVGIAAGESHVCAVRSGGGVACWGKNDHGQLGADPASLSRSAVPVDVAGLAGVAEITAGNAYTCVRTTAAIVKCWGWNDYGKLGNGTQTDSFTPVTATGVGNVTTVSAGADHTCARISNGTIKCWGANYYTQLGAGYAGHQQCSGSLGTWDCSPTALTVLDIDTAVDVDAGWVFTCAILADGTGRCWGVNSGGRLGNGTDIGAEGYPSTVIGLTGASAITSGGSHACAMTGNTARCWGQNNFGALGNGTLDNSPTPTAMDTGIPTIAYDPSSSTYPTSLAWKVVFDTAVTGITDEDFDLTGTTASNCQLGTPTGSGTMYIVPVTGCSSGMIAVRMRANAGTDAAGISRPPFRIAATPITLDTEMPWLSIYGPDSPSNGRNLTWTASFSEPVAGFTASDVKLNDAQHTSPGCAVQAPVKDPSDATVYTVTLTGCGSGVVRWYVPAGAVTDVSGNPGPALATFADAVVVDATGPTVGTPAVTIRTNATLSGSSVPVRVTWSGADNEGGTGLASFQLQRSLNAGAWTNVGTASLATSANVHVPSSGTVRFRVVGRDQLGNATTKTGTTFSPRLIQQSSSSVTWKGTWKTSTSTSWSGGTLRYSSTKGSSATFTFTGRAVALVTTNRSTRGKVKVYVNGTYLQTLDLQGTTANRIVEWRKSWPTSGTRTVKLVVVGTSGRPRVDVDAFVVFR